MSYVVLARKWRPRYFEEVVGQGHVAKTLKNSIAQDRVAHAYLFTGARGVGKTSTARILAKALNCHNGPSENPCYECPSCQEISQGQSIDVFEIDGASNRGINEIRELREGVRYAPHRDRYKIYIIDEVHMLTTEAFNALLKTLEEPPPHVKFVFATTEPQKIPVTILSRCQRFDFKRISQQDIVEHLLQICPNEGIQAEKAALQLIARQASGGMRDALSLMDQVISFAGQNVSEEQVTQILGVANRKHLFELSEAIIDRDAERALLALDDVHRYGYDLQQFASEMVTHLRDLMVARVVQHPERVTSLTESELNTIREPISRTTPDLLHRYFSVMIEGAQEMSRSPYPKLIFEMTLVRMCQLEPLVSIDLLVDRLHELEGLLGDVPFEPKKKSEHLSVLPVREHAPVPRNHIAPEARTAHEAPSSPQKPAAAPAPTPEKPQAQNPPPAPKPTPQPAQPRKPVEPAASERPLWEKPRETQEVAEEPPKPTPAPVPKPTPEPTPAPTPEPAPPAASNEKPAPSSPAPEEPEAVDTEEEDISSEAATEGPEGEEEADGVTAPPWVVDDEDPGWEHYEDMEEGGEEPESEPFDRRAAEDHLESEPTSYGIFSMRERSNAPNSPTLEPEDDDDEDGNPSPPPTIDIEGLGRQGAWKQLVSYIRTFQAPLAATLEQAYVEEFTRDKLAMTFLERYLHFIHDDKRLKPFEDMLRNIFGKTYKLSIQLRHDPRAMPGFETLAQLRDAELRARRDKLASDTEGHPAIRQAAELFDPDAVRILVALHED